MGLAHGHRAGHNFLRQALAENTLLHGPSGPTIEVILLFQTRRDISSSVGMRPFGVR